MPDMPENHNLDDEFGAFDPEVSMPTLPASEIRRRGDRMRRRNTALATVGGIAAVAIIAAPIGFIATRGDDSAGPVGPASQTPTAVDPTTPSDTPSDTPTDPPTAVGAHIPPDFPLAANLPEENEDGTPVKVRFNDDSDGGLSYCDDVAWQHSDAAETATATYSGPEDFRRRTLAVYFSPTEAADAFEKVLARLDACPSTTESGTETVFTRVTSDEDSAVYTTRWKNVEVGGFDTGLEVQRFEVRGNALLMAFYYGEGGGSAQSIEDMIDWSEEQTAPVVTALDQTWGDAVDNGDDPTTPTTPTTDGTIPEDLPMAAGWPVEFGDPEVPSDFEPYYDVCGSSPDAPEGTLDHVVASLELPEHTRSREIYTFPDVDAAEAYVADLQEFYSSCPRQEDSAGPDYDSLTDVFELEVGDGGFGAVTHFEQGGEPALGLFVRQVIRAGTAVLIDQTNGEGFAQTPAKVREQLDTATSESTTLVNAMLKAFPN